MKSTKIMIALAIVAGATISSCSNRKNNPPPAYYYTNVPDGGTAIIDNANLDNQGLLVNRSTTTWVIRGNVVMDDLSISGKVVIDPGANVRVKGTVTIGGGAKLQVNGALTATNITQTGDAFFNGGNVTISNLYTIGGGTTTYLQNSRVTVNDLRILGAITGLVNDVTKNGNVYSVFYFYGNSIYLNRAGGTSVCGPVLFTYNNDLGASGIKLNEVTATALNAKPNLKTIYQLPDNSLLYQYADQNCSPKSTATGF